MQYTVRNIPPELDRALKAAAKRLGKSVNQVALEALAHSVGQAPSRRRLRDMPGAWSKKEAEVFDHFLEQERQITLSNRRGAILGAPTRRRGLGARA